MTRHLYEPALGLWSTSFTSSLLSATFSHMSIRMTRAKKGHQKQQYKSIFGLQICDALEDQMTVGGNIIDFHSCDFFPERWFDLVIVLQTDNTILYDRLEKR